MRPHRFFGGRPVSFYNVVGLGLVEILERQTVALFFNFVVCVRAPSLFMGVF
jgi:hypothetical protein